MKTRLVEILKELQSDIGAPDPKVISDEHCVYLLFYLYAHDQSWDGTFMKVRDDNDLGIALVTFKHFVQYKFGGPNDETIRGHAYYEAGLEPYSITKVENSDWIEQLEKQNSVHPHHRPERYQALQHLIFFFHDTCFEIVCKDYSYELLNEIKMKEKMKEVVDSL